MFTENGKGTIFDNVKGRSIVKAHIPENDIIKPTKTFSINNDKFDSSLIVDEYKMPSFKYIEDNSINDFYDYPDFCMSQNPEYKYKYPKLSTAETIKAQWQTEKGIPNELNTFIRQDETGQSLEDIKIQDNAYQTGLQQIEKMIDEDLKTYKASYNDYRKNEGKMTDEEEDIKYKDMMKKEDKLSKKEGLRNRYVKSNPVLIKPAIQKKTIELQKKFKSAFAKKQTEKLNSGVEESKTDPQKAIITLKTTGPPPVKSGGDKTPPPPPPLPLKSPHTVASMRKRIDEIKARSAGNTPVTDLRKHLELEEENENVDDDKTVNNDVYSVSDTLKPSFIEAHKILDKFTGEKEGYNIKEKNPDDFVILNELCDKILNKPKGTNKWATFRKLSTLLHFGQTLTYVHTPKK